MITDLRALMRRFRGLRAVVSCVILLNATVMALAVTLFSVTDHYLLRRLPYPDADRIVHLHAPRKVILKQRLAEWRALAEKIRSQSLLDESTLVQAGNPMFLEGSEAADHWRLRPVRVSPAFFSLFGQPLIGRPLLESDRSPRDTRPMVISHELWERVFERRTDIFGRALVIPGTIPGTVYRPSSWEIVGVMPKDFALPSGANVWVTEDHIPVSIIDGLPTYARLRPGATAADVAAALPGIEVTDLADHLEPEGARAVLYLWITALCVVVSICVQVAMLVGMRSALRPNEIRMRLTLGANWRQAYRPAVLDGAALAALSGIATGLLLPVMAPLVIQMLPAELNIASDTWLGERALAFGLALVGFQVLLLSTAPVLLAIGLTRARPTTAGRLFHMGASAQRFLLAGQVGATVALTLLTAVAWQSSARATSVDPGFDPDRLYGVRLPQLLPPLGATAEGRMLSTSDSQLLYEATLQQVKALPGVVGAALSSRRPMQSPANEVVAIRSALSPEFPIECYVTAAFGDLMETVGSPIVAGRSFAASDPSSEVVMVNEAMARQLAAFGAVVGSELLITPVQRARVIGIFKNVVHHKFDDHPTAEVVRLTRYPSTLLFRLAGGHSRREFAAVNGVLAAVWGARAPKVVISVNDDVRRATLPYLSQQALLSLLAMAAAGVLAVGIYTSVSILLRQRRQELSIRHALGAGPADVRRCVWKETGFVVAGGTFGGLGAGAVAGTYMQHLWFEAQPTDFTTLVGVAVVVLLVVAITVERPIRQFVHTSPLSGLTGVD